ncbi:MAG: hypothetical protein HRT61_01050 [Ekhidna sp.]|nr:hypothetical protein [Ekhidna sp.]
MNNPKYYQHRYTHTKDVYLKVGESDDGKTLILENKVSGVRFIATSAMYEQVEQAPDKRKTKVRFFLEVPTSMTEENSKKLYTKQEPKLLHFYYYYFIGLYGHYAVL